MTAERLREAATTIRHDVEFAQHRDETHEFQLAIADWLDAMAAAVPPRTEGYYADALAVADAYLGRLP